MPDFYFFPLRPFLCAALAKRWKVQFRKGLHKFNNVDKKKRHILMRTAVLYICIYIYIYIITESRQGDVFIINFY